MVSCNLAVQLSSTERFSIFQLIVLVLRAPTFNHNLFFSGSSDEPTGRGVMLELHSSGDKKTQRLDSAYVNVTIYSMSWICVPSKVYSLI